MGTIQEVQALVIDNGSGMCKAGFAGDDGTLVESKTISKVCLGEAQKLIYNENLLNK
jgi:actin-related protein